MDPSGSRGIPPFPTMGGHAPAPGQCPGLVDQRLAQYELGFNAELRSMQIQLDAREAKNREDHRLASQVADQLRAEVQAHQRFEVEARLDAMRDRESRAHAIAEAK